ncbi:MAG: class II aldolase/adducin family protein [Mesorhizobium sp.]
MALRKTPITPADCSAEEWDIRCNLAALYRLLAHFKMTDLIYTHVSARLPGPENHFLINNYGTLFHEMKASDLVKIDIDGNVIDGMEGQIVNEAGFTIHSALHMARHDLMCVVHVHTPAGVAVSCQEQGLLPISQFSLRFFGHLAYHDYEGIALDLDERSRLIRDMGQHKAMILRNHGLLCGGSTVAEAFYMTYMLDRACDVQVKAQAGGVPLIKLSEEVCKHTASQIHQPADSPAYKSRLLAYENMWNAVIRYIKDGESEYRS